MVDRHEGRCQCGAVSYRATGLANIWYCHCRQCRRLTGHYMAACRTLRRNVEIEGEVNWTAVSQNSRHGFCATCHSPLFWSNRTSDYMSIVAGSLDHAIGIAVCGHIFMAEKGDYYEIGDGLPQYSYWPDTPIADNPGRTTEGSC